jgi:TonB-linked SusC/RagA family outer membrane protein
MFLKKQERPLQEKDVSATPTCIFRIAKICALIVLLLMAETSFSQRVSMNIRAGKLEDAFREIEKQTGYSFIYGKQQLQQAGAVTLSVKDVTLNQALEALFSKQPFSYTISGKFIAIRGKDDTRAANGQAAAQMTVSGNVKDEIGNPIPSVSVVVPGTPFGTMTNMSGDYTLANVPPAAELVFSYISYTTERIAVKGRGRIDVVMKVQSQSLDETVVIGYGTTTRRMNTGSVSSITSKQIETQPVANPLAALPGRIPGVQITQANGLPGSSAVVQIRGQSSLSYGNMPLYVIDGVPFLNFAGSQPPTDNLNSWGISGANGGISPFSMINPDDIERMDILKDADATSIYGARGANGVILITTKKGKAGKTKVNANVYTGTGKVARFIPMMNTQEYLALRKEAFSNDGLTPNTANAPELTVWDQNAYTDWQRLLIGGSARSTDAQASISGGDARTHFLFSTAYHRETTVYPGDFNDQRLTGRLSADHTSANGKLFAAVSVNYSSDRTNLPVSDVTTLYNLPPNMPLYDAEGKLAWSPGFSNPLALLKRQYKGTTSNLITNANIRYTILQGLNFKVNLGYTSTQLDQNTGNPASSQNPANNPTTSAVFTNNKTQNYIVEPTLDYTMNAMGGTLNVLAGGTLQRSLANGYNISGINYSSEALLNSLLGAGTVTVGGNNYFDYRYASFFGRVNYDWKGKYLLNATFRRDASSRFGPDNTFGNFGAVGAAWLFSNESFVSDALPWLSFGKIRASYGTTGNDQITNYIHLPLLSATQPYQGQTALFQATLPNQGIKWETTRKLEAAIELGFLQDRIMLIANYYRNRSGNQLLATSVATQSGYNSYTVNLPATVQNKGIELELNTTNIRTSRFSWNTSFNITFPKNRLVSFPNIEKSFYSSSYIVGQPIDLVRRYNYLGYDPGSGAPMYEDVNKDGAITFNDDRIVIPPGTPYYGGLNNTLTYRNWDFGCFFQFSHKKGSTNTFNSPLGSSRNNQHTALLDRWHQPGDEATYPAATSTPGTPLYAAYSQYSSSTALWGNAGYIRLRSANLAYNLPKKWLHSVRMDNCKIYAEGQNLFTWMKNKSIFDPETSVGGGPPGLGTGMIALPPLRTIVFGINCTF